VWRKSYKSPGYLHDKEPGEHSIQVLVIELSDVSSLPDLETWIHRASSLDRYYIPTRYSNGLPDLTPGQSYFKQDADSAITQALNFF
jgi:HEPN domain-containing protein